jgi:hypothetical protein
VRSFTSIANPVGMSVDALTDVPLTLRERPGEVGQLFGQGNLDGGADRGVILDGGLDSRAEAVIARRAVRS